MPERPLLAVSAQGCGEFVGVDDGEALRASGQCHVERSHAVLDAGDDLSGLDDDDTIELRAGASGLRYYLADRPVHGGDTLQLCFSGGWVTGRYEWNADPSERPRFHCSIELEGGEVEECSIPIPEGALLRRPQTKFVEPPSPHP